MVDPEQDMLDTGRLFLGTGVLYDMMSVSLPPPRESPENESVPKQPKSLISATRLTYASINVSDKPKKTYCNLFLHDYEDGSYIERFTQWPTVQREVQAVQRNPDAPSIVVQHHGNMWEPSTIQFNDADMQQVLDDQLRGFQGGANLVANDWTMKAPFMPMLYFWDQLEAWKDAFYPICPLQKAATALIRLVKPLIGNSLWALAHGSSNGPIKFPDAWLLYSPGDLVVTSLSGAQSICRVVKYWFSSRGDEWVVTVEFVDWDGRRCGYNQTTISVPSWKGFRRITELELFPLGVHPDLDDFVRRAVIRGRGFEMFRGYHYLHCTGTKISLETPERKPEPMNGKVCVDANAYYKMCNRTPPTFRSLDRSGNDGHGDSTISPPTSNQNEQNHRFLRRRHKDLTPLRGTERLLTTPWLKAFDMEFLCWCEVHVNDVFPVADSYSDDGENLIFPDDYEEDLASRLAEIKIYSSYSSSSSFLSSSNKNHTCHNNNSEGNSKDFAPSSSLKEEDWY